jgi:hypothetical protein
VILDSRPVERELLNVALQRGNLVFECQRLPLEVKALSPGFVAFLDRPQ